MFTVPVDPLLAEADVHTITEPNAAPIAIIPLPASIMLACRQCGRPFTWKRTARGRAPEYCSNRCRSRAWKAA